VGNAHIFRLGAVDRIAEGPATSGAVGIHAPPAIFAFATGRDAGDEDVIALMERGDPGAGFLDDADTLVAENTARCAGRDVACEGQYRRSSS
jgi:hypothetical protein